MTSPLVRWLRGSRWSPPALWLAVFLAVAFLARGAWAGGSIVGPLSLVLAATVATAGVAVLRRLSGRDREPVPGDATTKATAVGRILLGLSAAFAAFVATLATVFMAAASAGGCGFDQCDPDDRSPAGAVAALVAAALLAAATVWIAGWALDTPGRGRRIAAAAAAGVATAGGAVLVVLAAR